MTLDDLLSKMEHEAFCDGVHYEKGAKYFTKLNEAVRVLSEALKESTQNNSHLSRIEIENEALQKCEEILK